jgi:hypothetical protein
MRKAPKESHRSSHYRGISDLFTAPHFKEAATDVAGRRIGKHMEIQIFGGENELEKAYFSTD